MNKKIDEFWQWFIQHSKNLESTEIPSTDLKEFEARLFSIHQLDWEIGPGSTKSCMLAISPKGDRNLLALTREIVSAAPFANLPNWEFLHAKPSRKWNLEFSVSVDEHPVQIDAKKWEFIIFGFDDGAFDLVLKPSSEVASLNNETLQLAATIIADGELGEEFRMARVNEIEVVKKWDDDLAERASILEPGRLKSLMGG
jgi:hypothetical protein